MMIRSSSTPILGSLLPENPNNHHHHDVTLLHPFYKSSPIHKLSFHQTPPSPQSHKLSCNSSPISPSFGNNNGGGMIRRVQSEGNLESFITSSAGNDADPPKKLNSTRFHHTSLLETIPSFSYENSRFRSSDEEEEEEDEGFCEFGGFNVENKVLKMNKQMGFGDLEVKDDNNNIGETTGSQQMYLAKGLGIDSAAGFGCGSGGGRRNLSHLGGEGAAGGGDGGDVEEEHYRKMVNECPGNALVLRNYAQFLYESKQDLEGAEEYYSRAILVDPNDGEVLSQYAKLLWELHRDSERATTYFERAIQAASEDSHVHAAYASFLWETEGEDEEEEEGYSSNIPTLFNNGKMASAATF